jgi:hypothetical protein
LIESPGIAFRVLFSPLLFLGIVKLIPPQALHQLGWLNLELGRIEFGKLFHGKSPTMKPRSKTNSSFGRINLSINKKAKYSFKYKEINKLNFHISSLEFYF